MNLRFPFLGSAVVLPWTVTPVAAQFKGEFMISNSPAFLEARVDWETSSGKSGTMEVLNKFPFYFETDANFGVEDSSIDLIPVINAPGYLVSGKPVYTVVRTRMGFSPLEIHVKRKRDFHIEHRDRAGRLAGRNPDQAIALLDTAFDFAETHGQKLETLRLKAAILKRTGRHQDQQSVLAQAVEHLDAATTESHRKTYWEERYNAFLSWTNYLEFRNPDEEFGHLIEDSAAHRSAWRAYLEDLARTEGLELAVADSAEEFTAQLLAIKARFRYR